MGNQRVGLEPFNIIATNLEAGWTTFDPRGYIESVTIASANLASRLEAAQELTSKTWRGFLAILFTVTYGQVDDGLSGELLSILRESADGFVARERVIGLRADALSEPEGDAVHFWGAVLEILAGQNQQARSMAIQQMLPRLAKSIDPTA